MRFGILTLAVTLGLAACDPTETVTKYGGADYLWQLVEIDGTPVDYKAELMFGPHGSVNGESPCNTFSAIQSKPYPWIEIKIDVVEQIYCPDIDDEAAFFAALQDMSLVEVSGPNMVLSNDKTGRQMVFKGI